MEVVSIDGSFSPYALGRNRPTRSIRPVRPDIQCRGLTTWSLIFET